VDLDAKVKFLQQPEHYPDGSTRVEVVETHISWVFLTRRYAYKLKKPVRQPYLDFRTIDARHQDALEEVRLNRRLAGGVYLGVVPLNVSGRRRLRLGGHGRPVDWLVHMRRLPSQRMLDSAVCAGRATPDDLRRIGECLGQFYRTLPSVDGDAREYVVGFRDDIEENRRELSLPRFGLPAMRIQLLSAHQQKLLDRLAPALGRRVQQGRLIEGHGDLRPEHVCLLKTPVIIDCLEFKRAFRVLDPADELAYLALECERLGAPWAGPALLQAYSNVTGDRPGPALVHFYQAFRATLRAKIAIWHNRDNGVVDTEKWRTRSLEYLALAERHAHAAETAV
jgi:aminoglycoside phosphotransferase family enzyme